MPSAEQGFAGGLFHLCYPWIAGLDTNPPQTTSSFGANESITCASRVIPGAGSDHRRHGTQPQDLQTTVQRTVELEGLCRRSVPRVALHKRTKKHLPDPPWEGTLLRGLLTFAFYVLNRSVRNGLGQV